MTDLQSHSANDTQCTDPAQIKTFIEGADTTQEEAWRATRLAACIRGSRMLHISGLLVGPTCLLFRKCYLSGIIFTACYLLALLLGGPLFGFLATLCLNVTTSIAFAPLYQRRFLKAVERAAHSPSSEQCIRKMGGTNLAAAVATIVVLGIALSISLLFLFDEIYTFLEITNPESYLYMPDA